MPRFIYILALVLSQFQVLGQNMSQYADLSPNFQDRDIPDGAPDIHGTTTDRAEDAEPLLA
jgi:hypothetical protein